MLFLQGYIGTMNLFVLGVYIFLVGAINVYALALCVYVLIQPKSKQLMFIAAGVLSLLSFAFSRMLWVKFAEFTFIIIFQVIAAVSILVFLAAIFRKFLINKSEKA